MISKHKSQLKTLLSNMTLDEKLAQLGSSWMYSLQTKGELDWEKIALRLQHGIGQITRIGGATTFDPLTTAQVGNSLQKFLLERTRLGIPAIFHEESCSGAMVLGGTAFPQMIGLASSFQPELAEAIASVIRKQLLAIGARQTLAPVLDVAADPRWGRIEETFGEDPTLVSHFGMAYVRGIQGKNLSAGVMATGKHFIGHSLSQGGLNCAPVRIGVHDLYNTYLGPFQAAIRDAGIASMMNAYPELDGEVVAASKKILTDLLRHELGFDGLVVSDYDAILMLHTFHRTAVDQSAAAVQALKAGIDVELPTAVCYTDPLKAALEAGEIGLESVDLAVERHLQKKFELGLFEAPYIDDERVTEFFETREQRSLAHRVACQSMVLLKNDGLLPLKKNIRKLAVIGPNANNGRNQFGDYSYAATAEFMLSQVIADSSFANLDKEHFSCYSISSTTVLDGVLAAVSPYTRILYARGCDNLGSSQDGFNEALRAARQADAVILVLGDQSGLVEDCTTGEFRDTADLKLPGAQEELARAILAVGVPVVAVLINGRPYAIPWLAEHANAILEAWLPGEEGGSAIADVLFGETNPGGKLPISIPRHVGQLPVSYNHKPSGGFSHIYGDYVAEKVSPLFPFGHGLSYTRFEYSDLQISNPRAAVGENVAISLRVSNVGKVAGDEVVQLYIRDEYASTPRPVKELKGYIRVSLAPGEVKNLVFHLPVDQLAFYDLDLRLVLEPGRILVMVGSSSQDIRLKGEFEIVGTGKMLVKERVFVCPVEILNQDNE